MTGARKRQGYREGDKTGVWQVHEGGKDTEQEIIQGKWQVQEAGNDNEQETKKSRIRETSNLLTDADSSTNTTVGCSKNTERQKKFKTEKIIQNGKTQKSLETCQN